MLIVDDSFTLDDKEILRYILKKIINIPKIKTFHKTVKNNVTFVWVAVSVFTKKFREKFDNWTRFYQLKC